LRVYFLELFFSTPDFGFGAWVRLDCALYITTTTPRGALWSRGGAHEDP
jgi:hypothetical protein